MLSVIEPWGKAKVLLGGACQWVEFMLETLSE